MKMLPNDPMLALRAAQDTMAQRQYASAQERLAATVRPVVRPNSEADRHQTHLIRGSIFRRTTLVTVVLALSALVGAAAVSEPSVAARRVLATSPRTLVDLTSNRMRVVAIDPASDIERNQTTSRRVVL
jgi:hypothetical protein